MRFILILIVLAAIVWTLMQYYGRGQGLEGEDTQISLPEPTEADQESDAGDAADDGMSSSSASTPSEPSTDTTPSEPSSPSSASDADAASRDEAPDTQDEGSGEGDAPPDR